jgi:hypothetical protein
MWFYQMLELVQLITVCRESREASLLCKTKHDYQKSSGAYSNSPPAIMLVSSRVELGVGSFLSM